MNARDATDEQIREVFNLVSTLAFLRHASCTTVTNAVLDSETLRAHGYMPSQRGHLTAWQADAARKLLINWIEQVKDEARARAAEAVARAERAKGR